MSNSSKINSDRLSNKTVLAYGVGFFGYNALTYVLYGYMMKFYTDVVGVSISMVSFLLLFGRFFDAINDPIIGALADRTNTRWGRYRPWIFVSGITMAVLLVLLFSCSPEWSYGAKTAWLWVLYFLLTISVTGYLMPHMALAGVVTPNAEERGRLSGARHVFVSAGTLVIGLVFGRIITGVGGDDPAKGYFWAVTFLAVLSIPTFIITSVCVKEKGIYAENTKQKLEVWKNLKVIPRNRPVMVIMAGLIMSGFATVGRSGVIIYHFTYVLNDANLMSTYLIVVGISAVLSGFVAPRIISKVKSKKGATMIGSGMSVIALTGQYFAGANIPVFLALQVVNSMGSVILTTAAYSMIPDAVDYGEFKTGLRSDGLTTAMCTFCEKVGIAFGSAIPGFIMSKAGYVANAVQTPFVISVISICSTLAMAGIYLLAFLIFCGYDLSLKKHESVRTELEKRKMAQNHA